VRTALPPQPVFLTGLRGLFRCRVRNAPVSNNSTACFTGRQEPGRLRNRCSLVRDGSGNNRWVSRACSRQRRQPTSCRR